ncbi:MAG: lipoyl(octanoyl) transferase LipB [Hyphomonadaceae bacterium]|nr:lipoyl(octanoyl) transferase LipB [Hyphomonadaceae bacterium]
MRSASGQPIAEPIGQPVAWMVAPSLVPYETASAVMTQRASAIAAGAAAELVWLLEHPALYTAGTSAKPEDLIAPGPFPVHRTGRGGQFTYHGPGQRVAYVMLDVRRRFGDVRAYVASLEDWIIDTLAMLGVAGERQAGRVGVWVRRRAATDARGSHDKIAAIGVRLSRWVSSHGISLNVAPDLDHYAGIVACGIRDAGVTSLADLGLTTDIRHVDRALRAAFEHRFGKTVEVATLADGVGAPPRTAGATNESAPLPGGPSGWRARQERPA